MGRPFKRALVAGIFIAAAALRLTLLGAIPLPVQQDELSNIYDGYSIAETGMDRSALGLPIVVRGFGEVDYRPAMYAWLAAIPASVIGFSVAGGRLPAAVLGCVALLLLFSFATELSGSEFGIIALAIGAFSPWLISFSRVAHEGAMLPPFLMLLTFYLWRRADAKRFTVTPTMLLGFVVGFSANAYQSTRLTSFLMAVCISAFILRHSTRKWRDVMLFGTAAFVGAVPQLFLLVADPAHFAARSHDTLQKGASVLGWAGAVLRNFGLNVGPTYLFVPNMTETYLTSARLLPVEIILFYPGLLAIRALRGETAERFRPWLYAAVFIAIVPAALRIRTRTR